MPHITTYVCVCVINQVSKGAILLQFGFSQLRWPNLGLAIQATRTQYQQISTLAWIDQATRANSSIASTLALKGLQAANINQVQVTIELICWNHYKKRGYPSVLKSVGIAPKSAGIGSKFLSRRFRLPLFECGDRIVRTCTSTFKPCSGVFKSAGIAFMKMWI